MDQPQPTPYQPAPTQMPPANPAPMQPMPSGKSPKKFLIPLIVVLVLAGGYLAAAKSQSLWPFMPSTTPSPIASSSPSASPTPATSWKTYLNTQYGFELKFPPSWNGYTVATQHGSGYDIIEFNMPTKEAGWGGSALLFNITRCTLAEFAREKQASELGACTGLELGRDSNYVFTETNSQVAPPSDLVAATNDVESIVATFKLTK